MVNSVNTYNKCKTSQNACNDENGEQPVSLIENKATKINKKMNKQ